MKIKEINDEIFYGEGDLVKVTQKEINFLKEKALVAKRQRSRLCTHRDVEEPIHEMLIVHNSNTYVRPHKHLGKSESFHLIEGSANIVIFNEQGDIKEVLPMGERTSGKFFYYRMKEGLYHTLIIISDVIVFHEITKGPFNKVDTVFAPWSPEDEDQNIAEEFISRIKKKCEQFGFVNK